VRIAKISGLVFVIVALAWIELKAQEAAPAAGPSTLWQWLGIPQGFNKIKDATTNVKGNRPEKERTPPLKRIADPQNLKSDNPAIKTAAKIKQEEDLAPQKVKAIKYMADVGCTCYPGVKEALLAALDDCTEEVRYQAALAFCQIASKNCQYCAKGSCCAADVMTKLDDMAHGQDAKGCCKEASERVRAAAASALNACRSKQTGTPAPAPETVPERKELPLELAPGPEEKPRTPTNAKPIGYTPDAAGAAYIEDKIEDKAGKTTVSDSSPRTERSLGIQAIYSEDDIVMLNAMDGKTPVSATTVGIFRRCPYGCPCVPCPHVAEGAPGETGTGPEGAMPGEGAAGAAPSPYALAGNIGATAGPASAAPGLIGDCFVNGGSILLSTDDPFFLLSSGNVPIAGGDRGFKITEHDSPIPRNRVFFDYNHYQNAVEDAQFNCRNLDRYTFGVEKTFLCDTCSVEFRVPFVGGLNATQSFDTGASLTGTEFGNIPLVFKGILHRWNKTVLAGGAAVTFPTARDGSLVDQRDGELLLVRNDAFHVSPFLGMLWEPNKCWFVQGFAQVDFTANGNAVFMRQFPVVTGPTDLVKAGTYNDQNLLYLDLSVGRWLYRNPCARGLRGIAPSVELHYTTTMQDTDSVPGSVLGFDGEVTNPLNRVDILNCTAGLHFQFGENSLLTVAAAAPLRTGDDAAFDAEVQVQFTRYY
jgi:hypothetical protein